MAVVRFISFDISSAGARTHTNLIIIMIKIVNTINTELKSREIPSPRGMMVRNLEFGETGVPLYRK